jgi:flagellar protein FliS
MSINSYEDNRILSASPMELVRILYTAAARAVQDARESLRTGAIGARSRDISRAQLILLELSTAVDPSKGQEISERLLALYEYMMGRLAEANADQKDAPLAEVSTLLGTLQEAWSQCELVTEPELAMR